MDVKKQFNQEEFNRIYKGTLPFCTTKYFSLFLELLTDEQLLLNIRFVNDILKIPPVKCMIEYRRDFFSEKMSPQEKQGLGACFGYLYRHIYGYTQTEQAWVGDIKNTGIKTASIFMK